MIVLGGTHAICLLKRYIVPSSFTRNCARHELKPTVSKSLKRQIFQKSELPVGANTHAHTMDAPAEAAKPRPRPCLPHPLLLVLLMALGFASSNVLLASAQGSGDSCSNGLSLGGLVPFNTTGLSCFQAWPSQDFILRVRSELAAINLSLFHVTFMLACMTTAAHGGFFDAVRQGGDVEQRVELPSVGA